MNDLERRLADLLHDGAPEPARTITAAEIEGLAQDVPKPKGGVTRRWGAPLLAAAAVLVAVAVPAVVVGHANSSATPTSPASGAPTPAPTTATAPTPTSSGTSSPSSTPRSTAHHGFLLVTACLTSQLSLKPGLTSGAAGSLYTTFYLTKTAGPPCSMHGFPGVSLLNDAGVIVGQPATRDGSLGPSVRLDDGQRALFILRVGTATRTGCNLPRPSSQIEVYPPGQTVPMRIPFATGSCAISVQSVTAAK